ncbi:DUF3105 domain-containing protein [Nocardioides sp. SYSU DS0651]|uniref:DUF3105 domain-containing protein n=1 Tax=Nocardioides sp. SYSU DS0651 TaxID=3415955 RepID=UPI003F4B2ACD
MSGQLPPSPAFPPGAYGPPPASRRRRVLPVALAVVAAVLVLALAVLVPVLLAGDDEDERAAGPDDGPDTSLADVRVYGDLAVDHVPDGVSVDYPQSPPVGGRHAQAWLECGVYDAEVPVENVVHSLEHGTVWLTYRADRLDAEEVAALAAQLPDNGILSPYPDQKAPVVATVWGRQLALTGPDDPRIPLFVAEHGAGDTAPEPLASCHGGVRPGDVGGDRRAV